MNAAPAIEIDGFVKNYGTRRAVDGLWLRVDSGEVFGLLGPNGAGKTTTVETLEGYRRADGGTVRVLGLDPWGDGDRLRPQIGVMLQEGGLNPTMKPLEVLQLFAAFYDNPDDPARLLTMVGLDDDRGTLVRRLSGGQRQRLSLALALIGRPRLVFLDEPTAGMDPVARATTWRSIRELRDHGVTVLLTTHAMDEAEHLCDRLAIIDHGRLVALGTPAELTARSSAPQIGFSTAPGLDRDAIARALSLPAAGVVEVVPGEYSIDAQPTPARLAELTAYLATVDALLAELHTGRSSLEAVFLNLTTEPPPAEPVVDTPASTVEQATS
jgi:ABC-2 type transport system ATP-binding protein